MSVKRKKVLFVDDDPQFLELVQSLMSEHAGDSWEIHVALESATALALLQQHAVDLLVIDVHMPVVDGLQFLKLLQRKYPDVLKVVLTGDSSGAYRAECLNNGAELFLEKPRAAGGWQSIHATLAELVKFQPEEGFRGVLRRVGLQDVLQMECLSRNSSVLEVSAGEQRGRIYIEDGNITHAQLGERKGEEAFNHLLALSGGEFHLQSFSPPEEKTITGSWESLLMEAARQRDEATERSTMVAGQAPPSVEFIEVSENVSAESPGVADDTSVGEQPTRPRIDELLLCSVQGDVLYEWQCANTSGRISFLEFLSQKARVLGQGLPLGHFDRLEIEGGDWRVISQIQDDRALLVQCSQVPIAPEAAAIPA